MDKKKILILRFSSFGDIVQSMSTIDLLAREHQVDFLVKSEFSKFVALSKNIHNVISFDKKSGILGLIKLALKLRKNGYTHFYDAHSNLRSSIFSLFFKTFNRLEYTERKKERFKRFLLFTLRINKFPWPYKGAYSYIWPIERFLSSTVDLDVGCQLIFDQAIIDSCQAKHSFNNYIVFAPSAAWEMKRWPISHWKSLVNELTGKNIILLGGPEDVFCEEISNIAPDRVLNLAGKTSLIESFYLVSEADMTISADTGILHVSDILKTKTIALIGPTAFGFPSSKKSIIQSVDLPCRPCTKDGRGKCSQEVYQKCMVDILPSDVKKSVLIQLDS